MRAARWLSGAVALGIVGTLSIGIAAPANALVPPTPPNPVSLSSELAAAGAGVVEGGAGIAGSAGVAALGVAAPLGVAVSGFSLGFQAVGMVLAPFGIDNNANVCQIVQDTGTQSLNLITNVLTGADCSQQMTANQLTPAQQNADQAPTISMSGSLVTPDSYTYTLSKFDQSGGIDPGYTDVCVYGSPSGGSSLYRPTFQTSTGAPFGWGTASGGLYTTRCGPGSLYVATLLSSIGVPTQWGASLKSDGSHTIVGAKSPVTTASSTANPSRTWICETTDTNGGIYTKTSPSFTQTDATIPQPSCPTLPAGVIPKQVEIDLVTPGEANQVFWKQSTTAAFDAAAAAYPECTTGVCQLRLYTSDGKDCGNLTSCADWFTDPAKSSDYVCHYGTHAVALAECNVLAPFYNPQKVAAGKAYANPSTGADPSSQTSINTDQGLANEPAPNPDSTPSRASCFPTGWGQLNPLNWVVQPIQCAFKWAFIPRQSAIDAGNSRLKGALAASAIGSIGGILAGIATFPITGGGCSGIPWDFTVYSFHSQGAILAACPGDPLADTAVKVKGVATVVVWTAAVFAWARYVASIFGYIGYGSMIDQGIRDQRYHETRVPKSGVKFK